MSFVQSLAGMSQSARRHKHDLDGGDGQQPGDDERAQHQKMSNRS
jgi:hypothetical protein